MLLAPGAPAFNACIARKMASQNQTSHKVTYAHVAQQVQVPTKDLGIVLDSIDGIPVQEYALAVGKIIDPSHIKFISRIFQGRVCLYLNSKETVDKLLETQPKVKIGSMLLEIRPLMSKAKRIIISNVSPIITNELILEQLSKLGILPCSPISYIRVGISDPRFSHILSFRRQMYINPKDVTKLPPSIPIHCEDTLYYIYLSADKLSCFICKEEDHLAKFFKTIDSQLLADSNETIQNKSQLSTPMPLENSSNTYSHDDIPENQTDTTTVNNMSPPLNKRLRSSSTSTIRSDSVVKENIFEIPTAKDNKNNTVKKMKKAGAGKITRETLLSQLNEASDFISANASVLSLDLQQIADFLFECYGSTDIPAVTAKYSNNLDSMYVLLDEIANKISDKTLKARILRIKKRLANSDTRTSFSDCSSVDSST